MKQYTILIRASVKELEIAKRIKMKVRAESETKAYDKALDSISQDMKYEVVSIDDQEFTEIIEETQLVDNSNPENYLEYIEQLAKIARIFKKTETILQDIQRERITDSTIKDLQELGDAFHWMAKAAEHIK